MDAYRVAFNTWQEKTEWVQKDKRFDVLLPWGKHRADVLKEYIDHLEAKCAAFGAELEAKDSTISTQQQEIRTLLNALEQATEKLKYDIPGQKRLIGWRASDYTDETSDPELAKNWAAAIGVLPIFEGDVNTKLSTAGIGVKGGGGVIWLNNANAAQLA